MAGNGHYEILKGIIRDLTSVVVAYSGGVDSTLLLKVCSDVLGPERVLAFIGSSSIHPRRETREAVDFAKREGVRWMVVETGEMESPAFTANQRDRCYVCKSGLLAQAWEAAKRSGYRHVVEGSNRDDDSDFRPGSRAVAEKGVLSPLRMAGFTKTEIRELSRMVGLPTHDKPSFACLASRVPYGTPITGAILERIELSEAFLQGLGLAQVRVRYHGDVARIEVDEKEIATVMGYRDQIREALEHFGFTYVTLDLRGYRTGSMNEVAREDGRP